MRRGWLTHTFAGILPNNECRELTEAAVLQPVTREQPGRLRIGG